VRNGTVTDNVIKYTLALVRQEDREAACRSFVREWLSGGAGSRAVQYRSSGPRRGRSSMAARTFRRRTGRRMALPVLRTRTPDEFTAARGVPTDMVVNKIARDARR